MIEGLKFVVKGEELKHHLVQRAAFHYKRVAELEGQLNGMKSLVEKSHASGNVIEDIEKKMREHVNKAGKFAFMADHADVLAQYLLSDNDLATVEFVERSW